MRQELLRKIREACILANPEIMELKVGCKVRYQKREYWFINEARTHMWIVGFEPDPIARGAQNHVSHSVSPQRVKVIGRSIRLADVLLAIGNLLVIVDCGGNFYRMSMKLSDKLPKLDPKNGTARWNLRKDDLAEQSNETLQFLAQLLTK